MNKGPLYKKCCAVLFLIGILRGDWVIEQKASHEDQRVVISRSAYKLSVGHWDLIADFEQKMVWRVNRETKTAETIGLDEYLNKMEAGPRQGPEKPSGSGVFAGMACGKYSYSYTAKDPRTAGGWGGGESCYTKAIGVAEPYQRAFLRWLKLSQGSKGEYGVELWRSRAVDGPSRVNLETVRLVEKPVSGDEFRVPAGYRKIEFQFER
jgi:hypothetical protein